jgi:hypothetical protein
LQGDGSIRIRLISANGVNLRLNSDTGLVANVDTPLLYSSQSSPFADAAAYINSNRAVMAGTTVLYDIDFARGQLSTQSPPNDGTLNPVGSFYVDRNPGVHFDVLTEAADADPSIVGDHAYAAIPYDLGRGFDGADGWHGGWRAVWQWGIPNLASRQRQFDDWPNHVPYGVPVRGDRL